MLWKLFDILAKAARSAVRSEKTVNGTESDLTTQYIKCFESHVYKRLGGLDMAEDFFHRHPDAKQRLRTEALYHHRKGGAAWKGAAIFHRWIVQPHLRADRQAATRTRIGGDR